MEIIKFFFLSSSYAVAEKIEQMNEVAEKWKKSHAENAENAENNADSTSKRRERCHWLPSALIGCVQGNIARVC